MGKGARKNFPGRNLVQVPHDPNYVTLFVDRPL